MRNILVFCLSISASVAWADCDQMLRDQAAPPAVKTHVRFGQRLRGIATAAALAATASTMTTSSAEAANFMTSEDIRKILTEDYSYSAADAERVVQGLEKADPQHKLPITGVIRSSGFSLSLFLSSATWRNVTVKFKDEATDRMITTNCLYDMYYENGGLVASIGYKWTLMFLTGDIKANELAGATFGRGIGFTWDSALGADFQYLPADNRASGMWVLNPQIGAGIGFRFPRVTFSPAETCPR